MENLKRKQELEERRSEIKLDSLMAERLISANPESFASIQREQERLNIKADAKLKDDLKNPTILPSESFPYQLKRDENLFQDSESELKFLKENVDSKIVPDKGFFVHGDMYQDEYVAATAADVPEDEMNE